MGRFWHCDREIAVTGVRVLPLKTHFLDILRQGEKRRADGLELEIGQRRVGIVRQNGSRNLIKEDEQAHLR